MLRSEPLKPEYRTRIVTSEDRGSGRVEGTSCTTDGSRLKDVMTILRMGRGMVVVMVGDSEGWEGRSGVHRRYGA